MGSITSTIVPRSGKKYSSERPPPPKFYPDFVSSPVDEFHREFMKAVCVLLLNHGIFHQKRRHDAPLRFRKPDQLYRLIDYRLRDKGMNMFQLMSLIRRILYYSPNFSHPYYMYQLLAGVDPYSIVGDFVTSIVPSTMCAFREAPVYYMMEQEITKQIIDLIGYPDDVVPDVIFPPGCSICNTLSFHFARYHKFPDTKTKGSMHLPRLAVFISQDSHCCYPKGSIFTSIGLENLILVRTDSKGRMSVPNLIHRVEECIKDGMIPLMVGATTGTNVFGAFDPLEEIAKVCQQYEMWLHSDGAYGGGVIFSEKHRPRLNGIQLCDSFAFNVTKMAAANQTCAVLVSRHKDIFTNALGVSHTQVTDFSSYDDDLRKFLCSDLDTVDKYIEHARRPDICKFFMMWKGKGLDGLGANVDQAYERTQFFVNELQKTQNYSGRFIPLLEEFESPVVPFYYIPHYLLKMDRSSSLFKERLDKHTSFLYAELIKDSVMVITVQNLRQSPLFFKVVVHNSALTENDLIYLISQIDNYGHYLRVPMEMPHALPTHDPDTDSIDLVNKNLRRHLGHHGKGKANVAVASTSVPVPLIPVIEMEKQKAESPAE